MKVKTPVVAASYPDGYLLREKVPNELKGKVDEEVWPGCLEICVKERLGVWSVWLEFAPHLKETCLPTRKEALRCGKLLFRTYMQGYYDHSYDYDAKEKRDELRRVCKK